MRGESRAASARLPGVAPARRWSAQAEQVKQWRRERRQERAEAIVRMHAEQRSAPRPRRPERAA